MSEREPFSWPASDPRDDPDSLATQIAARIDAISPAPGDAIEWAAVAAGLEREAAALGARPAAAPFLFEAGRIYEERLRDASAALEFHRRSFALDRAFLPNLGPCRRLALHLGDDALAAEVLAVEASAVREPGARAELLLLLSRVLARLGKAAEARDVLSLSLATAPSAFAAAEEAIRLAAERGDPAALAAAYLAAARAAADRGLSAHYLSAAAALLEEALGQGARAAAIALDAFALLPSDPLIRAAARQHAERLGRDDVLAEILRAEAEASAGAAAAEAWRSLARLEERAGRTDGAVAALEKGRAAAPRDPLVLSELARLRELRGAWADASVVLEELARAHLERRAPGHLAEAAAARLRRAEIEEHELGRSLVALECCREVLAADPGNRAALSMLGRLHAGMGDWDGLLAAFEAEAASARGDRERALRLFKAGEVLEERLGRMEEALARYREAMALDRELLAARAAVERICEAEGRWGELCTLLEEEAGGLEGATARVSHLFRIARIREERLSDLPGAAALYARILEVDPRNRVAGAALQGALGRLERWRELADHLAREAAAEEPRRRVALLQRRAELLDAHVDDPEVQRAAWEALRAEAPGHVTALRALGRLHARAGRWRELAEMYRAEAAATSDAAQAAELLHRAGELAERRLESPEEAIGAYRDALGLAPGHLPSLEALARLHRSRGEHARLVENLRAQATARGSADERAAALAEAARIVEERLGDDARAVEAYEEALALSPGHAPALRALDRLYAASGRTGDLARLRRAAATDRSAPDRAERLLRLARLEADRTGDAPAALRAAEEILAARPDHPSALLLVLRLSPDPERRARARLALAGAAEEPDARAALLTAAALDLRPAAARGEALSRAAALSPGSPVLAPEEERRLREAGDPAALARFCEARRAEAADDTSRTSWSIRAGEAWERADEPDRALAAFQEALATAPASLPALRGARALFARRGDWAAVRGTLHAEASALRDPHGAAAAWIEAGSIADSRFGDPEAAAADFRRAAERDPANPEPLRRIEALLGARGAPDVARLHEARARAEKDARRAAEAWLESARAALDSQGGGETAIAALGRALEARPDLGAALELRSRVHAAAGRPREALADCEACLALGGEPATRLPLHLSAAALLEESLGDPERALGHVQDALALAPESPEALTRLARLLSTLGRAPESAAALRRLVDVPGLPRGTLVSLLLSLAEADERAGSRQSARSACQRALAIDPGHDDAHRRLLRLDQEESDPRRRLPSLEAAADAARDPALRAEAHVEAAKLRMAGAAGRTKALAHLRAALAADPTRVDARARLADLLSESAPAEASEQHRQLLAVDPLRADSWATLYRHWERIRAHDRAYVAASVLRWLGAALPGPAAEPLLREGDGQPLGPPPSLREEDLALLRAPGDGGPLAGVIEAAGDAIAASMGESPERMGNPVRSDHPLRRALEDAARAAELPAWELYAGTIGRVDVEPAVPYRILVGPDVARRTTLRERRFLAGRAMERLRSRSCLCELLPAAALSGWVAAAVHCVVPGARGLPADEVVVRQVGRALSRRARKALEGPARALAALGSIPDIASWQAAAAATADRAGLVLCGDVAAALGTLLGEGAPRVPKGEEAVRAATARPDVLALLAWASTDDHFALRQRLRTAIA